MEAWASSEDIPTLPLLLAAAQLGHDSVVHQLLLAHPDPHDIDPALFDDAPTHLSPIHAAAFAGHAAVTKLLLQHMQPAAASCMHTTFDGGVYQSWTLMHSAASSGSVETIQAVLAAGGDAGVLSDFHHTPLHEAAQKGCVEATRLLLEASPTSISVADDGGSLPLHWAACGGSAPAVQLLLEAGSPGLDQATVDGALPLHLAAESGNAEVLQLLLDLWPAAAQQAAASGKMPLHLAAGAGCAEAVQLLLDAWPAAAQHEENDSQCRPLHRALEQSGLDHHMRVARILLPISGLPPDFLLVALPTVNAGFQPLYADLVAHFPLTTQQWQRVPMPCPDLFKVLPAVLARSEAEARHLVAHLPTQDRVRLRTFALCLARCQRVMQVCLPTGVVRSLLVALLSS